MVSCPVKACVFVALGYAVGMNRIICAIGAFLLVGGIIHFVHTGVVTDDPDNPFLANLLAAIGAALIAWAVMPAKSRTLASTAGDRSGR
jgi:hypothetical protein